MGMAMHIKFSTFPEHASVVHNTNISCHAPIQVQADIETWDIIAQDDAGLEPVQLQHHCLDLHPPNSQVLQQDEVGLSYSLSSSSFSSAPSSC